MVTCIKCKRNPATIGPRGGSSHCDECRDYMKRFLKAWRGGGRLVTCVCGTEFTDHTGREFCSLSCERGPEATRTCRVCGVVKPLEKKYFRTAVGSTGKPCHARDCNDCHKARCKRDRDRRMANSPDEVRAYGRKKYARRPEVYRGLVRKRHALKRGSMVEPVDFTAILTEHGMICYLCGFGIASMSDLHFDHVHPLIRQGPHTHNNIRPTHASCNVWKSDKYLSELDLDARRAFMARELGLVAA